VDDEVIVLDLSTSEYLTLNDTGAVLWVQLESCVSAESLCESLISRWGIDRETAEQDVEDFLAYCRDANFIERCP
jgi:hypothetical protein